MDEIYKRLGYYMKMWREKSGMSQEEVAKKLGITQAAYSYYELGQRKASIDLLLQIEKLYLDMDILQIVRECDNDQRDKQDESQTDN